MLVDELRERGVPLAEAVALAAQRLGEPRQLAREHARVRSPFGARLSRARAWSATALLVLPLALGGHYELDLTIMSLNLIMQLGLVAALGARRTWARALVLGMLAASMLDLVDAVCVRGLMFAPDDVHRLLFQIVATVAALAFIAPWRRGDLSRRGVALALLAPAYLGALHSLAYYGYMPHAIVVDPLGSFALAASVVAIAGVLRKARWASLAAAVAACGLGVLAHTALVADEYGRIALLGAVCALGASIVLWRGRLGTARNAVG